MTEGNRSLTSSRMVLPRDLNPRDTLFAGSCANFMIETGFLTAEQFLGHPHMVCFALNGMKFLRSVARGTSVVMEGEVIYAGKSSIGIYVQMKTMHSQEKAAECFLSYVCIDEKTRRPVPHQKKLGALPEERLKQQQRYIAYKNI